MASPFKSIGKFLFGSSGGGSPTMLLPQQAPQAQAAPPAQSPFGTPSTYKAQAGAPSFIGGAAPPLQQTGQKTLLGQ